ncbi:MAG: hypothetical protein JXO72_12585 [Vicinamibacteria bacterium]|nr:hypothetical protein [Vicinamibacteria bacterium]
MNERISRLVDLIRWPLAVVLAAGLLSLVAWRACHIVEEGRNAGHELARGVGEMAERFKSGRITTTFVAAIPRLEPGGPLLELAAFEATETFTRTDERAVLFDLIRLGKTVAEIRAPVTYRYHLRLSDPWHLDVRGAVCLVRAPRIRATLPPAIHTDRMEKRSERGWLRFNVEEQMAVLERSITPTLVERAADRETLDFVRETCRRRVAEFVRGWLLREDQWSADRFTAVTVVFEDESGADLADRSPTLIREP